MERKYINEQMCSECKGACCKKGGCQYEPKDFELIKFNYLLGKLNEGYISIVAALDPYTINGKNIMGTHLYIKSRNVDRPIIDLYSPRTRCSALTENGCIYDAEHRPSGGLNLIPAADVNGRYCYPEKDPMEYIAMWEPYQNLLRKLVKHITGKSVEAKLKEDIYKVFLDVFHLKFDGVSKEEIQNILENLMMLQIYFPDEYNNAMHAYQIQTGQLPLGVKER